MKYLKRYNEGFFDYFKSKKKTLDNKDISKLNWIFKNYKSDEVGFLNASIEDSATGGIVLRISWSDNSGHNHFNIFSGEDGDNRIATMSSNYDKWPVISDSDFNNYKKNIQEISDYLDNTENISKSSVGDGIDLNIDEDEINYMEAQENLKKLFKEYFNKKYQFEANFYEWSSNSKNQEKTEDITITIYDILGRVRSDGTKSDFCLDVKCKLDDKRMFFLVDKNSLDKYLEISSIPKSDRYSKLLSLNYDDNGLSRVEKRKLEEERKEYPRVIS